MRLVSHLVLFLALRRFWRRRFTDQYAFLVADIGLNRDEEQALLRLRRSR